MHLAEIAPRLALARDQYVARRKRLEKALERCERLVIHRDLQYYRALATNNGRYIDKRAKKLELAKRDLEFVQDQLLHG